MHEFPLRMILSENRCPLFGIMRYKAAIHARPLRTFMTLVSIPANPVPDHVVSGMIKTPDGVIEKYFETARDLRARGFAVATFDWRGQGMSDRALSDRHKGYVRAFADYITDLDAVLAQVVLPDCPPPIYGLAHSMGGAIAIRALHDGNRSFERVVLSAPMIALPAGALSRFAGPLARFARLLGRGSGYVPTGDGKPSGAENFIGNVLTSDPVRFARNAAVLEEEPQLGIGAPTVAWVDAAMRVMNEFAVPSYANRIRQPILMVAAGRDEVVSTPAIETFGMNLLAGRHLILAGSRHEILQEQDHYRGQFWAAFDAFVPGTPLFG